LKEHGVKTKQRQTNDVKLVVVGPQADNAEPELKIFNLNNELCNMNNELCNMNIELCNMNNELCNMNNEMST
jgi:hypothetical protein